MIKFYVVNEATEIWSDGFNTKDEAEAEKDNNLMRYGDEAIILEVNER